MELEQFVEEAGGVVSVPDLAGFLGIDEQPVRDWAESNGVPRVGNSYAFLVDAALELAEDLLDEEPDEDADDDDADDDDADADADDDDADDDDDDDDADDDDDDDDPDDDDD